MSLRCLAPVAVSLLVSACARPPDHHRDIAEFAERVNRAPAGATCPIALVAKLNGTGQRLQLSFSLTNSMSEPITAYPEALPWGNVNSLSLVAFDESGHALDLSKAIDDPGPAAQFSVPPGATVSGNYGLCMTSLCSEAKKTRLVLIWAYAVPGEKGTCTGVTVIPRQQ